MESRRIEGQVAVRGLLGNGWVYLNTGWNGLRMVNLPSWATAALIATAFASCEDVGAVNIVAGRGRVRIATIEMEETIAKQIMKAPARVLESVSAPPAKNVFDVWRAEYEAGCNAEKVREWADATMATHELRERKREEARQRLREQGPDEDGFELVVDGAPVRVAEKDGLDVMDVGGKKVVAPKGVETDGFYRWQKRKSQLDIDGLREKFNQDRKRVRAAAALKLHQTN